MTAERLYIDYGGFQSGVSVPDIARELNLPGDSHSDLVRQLANEYQVVAETHSNRIMTRRSITEVWLLSSEFDCVVLPFPTPPDVLSITTFRWRPSNSKDEWNSVDDSIYELGGGRLIRVDDTPWPWTTNSGNHSRIEIVYEAGLATDHPDRLLLQSAVSSAVRQRIHGATSTEARDACIEMVRPAIRIPKVGTVP